MLTSFNCFQIVSTWILLSLRLVLATFCVIITIVSGVRKSDAKWFIYLTNWSFLLLTLAMIGLTVISIIHAYKKLRNCDTESGKVSIEMRNPGDVENVSTMQAQEQSERSQTRRKSLVWYEKGERTN